MDKKGRKVVTLSDKGTIDSLEDARELHRKVYGGELPGAPQIIAKMATMYCAAMKRNLALNKGGQA